MTPGLIGSGSGSVGFEGSISGLPNPRKGVTEPEISNIEPGDLGFLERRLLILWGLAEWVGDFSGLVTKFFVPGARNWLCFVIGG